GDPESNEVVPRLGFPDAGGARREVQQWSIRALERHAELACHGDRALELGARGGIRFGGGVGQVRPEARDAEASGVAGGEGVRYECRPLFDARAVTVQARVDLEV